MLVAWNMGEWHEFARLKNFPVTYRTILLATFFLTVIFDLTVAVQVGLVLASLFFIYRISQITRIEPVALAPAEAAAASRHIACSARCFSALSRRWKRSATRRDMWGHTRHA